MSWRDEVGTRWALWEDLIEALDRVLSSGGFPGLEQESPEDDPLSPRLRLTVKLRTNTGQHGQAPRIFIMVTAAEFSQVRNTQHAIDLLLKGRIAQTSFTDNLGTLVRTSIVKGHNGIWTAIDVNGQVWEFDENQGYWIKGPFIA
jgi:Trp operon repressor